MVAESIVLRTAAYSTNRNVSLVRLKASTPLANRLTRYAPLSASAVLPRAMARDVRMEQFVVTLTRKAPAKTAGQILGPNQRQAASDRPEGTQIAVALGETDAKRSPNFPVRTYAPVTANMAVTADVPNSILGRLRPETE